MRSGAAVLVTRLPGAWGARLVGRASSVWVSHEACSKANYIPMGVRVPPVGARGPAQSGRGRKLGVLAAELARKFQPRPEFGRDS
ncbi:hypothetical protein GCM10022236_24040 [Microlunatus ginsengisoli]|uniref:Uncharacterized protein n=1 Tax=Microlunatus ginsengisoli TaxID=363863 RepID=A0ABP7A0Z5_9ACTN